MFWSIYSGNGIVTPYNNAARQETVNNIAEYVGAGTGTAFKDGVPGTDRGVTGYGYGSGYGNGFNGNYGNRYNGLYGQGFGLRYGPGYGQGFAEY